MKMETIIEVGYNVRTWTTYTVKDATPEEIEILTEDGPRAVSLGAQLEEAGRLIEQNTSNDDNPEIFAEAVDCSIISVTTEEVPTPPADDGLQELHDAALPADAPGAWVKAAIDKQRDHD